MLKLLCVNIRGKLPKNSVCTKPTMEQIYTALPTEVWLLQAQSGSTPKLTTSAALNFILGYLFLLSLGLSFHNTALKGNN